MQEKRIFRANFVDIGAHSRVYSLAVTQRIQGQQK
jgi:hypothetical protein